MKKIVILILSLSFLLVGCSEGQVKRAADKFISDSKNLSLTDSDYVTNELAKKLNEDKENFINEVLDSLGINERKIDLNEIDGYDVLVENLKEMKSKTKYEINNVKLNDKKTKATVSVNIEYVNIGELLLKEISESLDRNVLKVYSNEIIDEKEFLTMTIASINKSIEGFNYDELYKTKNAEVNLIKQKGEWLINEVDEKTLNTLTLGFLDKKMLSLNDKLSEVKENRLFLEIESNLRSSFEIVNKLIKDDKVSYDKLTKSSDKINEALSKLNIKSEVVKKAGKENGVYYIHKGTGENELTITVINENEKFTFTEKVEK